METYKDKINEFVDWTTGINSITGTKISGVDETHPISGKSIRELLLDRIKTPFVTLKDDVSGYIRFFSSEEAKILWENYSKPESPLYNPEKALLLELYNMDIPATYKITGLDSFVSTRYIIDGNSSSINALLDINLGIEDALGSSEFDVLTVSYTIKDNSETIRYSSSDLIETGQHIVKLIYQYLKSGENKVSISVSANNHNAKTTKSFSIFLVTFSISSNFSGYYNPVANTVPFSFDIFIKRSITNLPITTTIYIDGSLAKFSDTNRSDAIWKYSESSASPSLRVELYNLYESSNYESKNKHTLKIESKMEDVETGTSFYSNILFYEFEVSPSVDDLVHSYVNIAASIPNGSYSEVIILDDYSTRLSPIIKALQYFPITLTWGYNTDSFSQFLLSEIEWCIRKGQEGEFEYTPLITMLGIKNTKLDNFSFIPGESLTYEEDNSFLIAYTIRNGERFELETLPISVEKNSVNVSEYGNYSLKLSGFGKSNNSDAKNLWIDSENNILTTFSSGVSFDEANGWNNNSLVLKGSSSYAIINYCPFPLFYNGNEFSVLTNGSTFEIDFKPEYVANEGDLLIRIGSENRPHIDINTNSAGFYVNNLPIVKTNFKSGERIKLAFIFNRQSEISKSSNLVYIINNGILEKAALRGNTPLTDNNGNIKIGGSNSSVRVYLIRAYRQDLTPRLALDNYLFDNISNVELIARNDVYGDSSEITYSGMSGKLDIITIEGDLTNILSNKSEKLNATVTIKRESNTDSEKNFIVENCRLRNHGQSTLSYPITSMKLWLNKSNRYIELIGNNGATSLVELVPQFSCPGQSYLGLNKNRYIMKSGSIPANKYVLQANYADSSGTHNGSLLRLILNTWYNAQFGEDKQFKLRTAPQLFSSGAKITHDNLSLNEDGTWVEGLYNIPSTNSNYNENWANKTWSEITNTSFPYQIRIAADSFPCTVFYKDTSTDLLKLTLLGLYVFMDDKKSDYTYGERSIYYTDDTSDPFCLKIENSKKDKKANKVWDNSKVLLVEVVYPNSPLTGYVSKIVASSYMLDENDNLVPDENAVQMRFDSVTARDSSNRPIEYLWEQHFELIYPDKEDIVDNNNNFDPVKFAETILPFEDFLEWITDVAALNTGTKLGDSGAKAYVTLAELDKFIAEAHDHLDLYKLAAYYIFFLRFGLVDSVERNALLKTYDGLHWHYEPWDMDIALGKANTGVIAYDPPITRDSRTGGSGYVFAGRTSRQSNTLWDCLEAWDYWANTLVPEVALALYDAGLTYDEAVKMFDQQYSEKWSETLYNESGFYKYIDATSVSKYRLYLNGSGMSHRHWWLSKSMNYYDAKWSCGDFAKHNIVIRIGKLSEIAGISLVKIYPTSNTFFKMVYGAVGNQVSLGDGLMEATINNGATIDVKDLLEDKQPCFIFGATQIRKLDLSGLLNSSSEIVGAGYSDISFGDAYDSVLGALLRELNLGAPCTPNIYEYPNENSYTSNLTVGGNDITGVSNTGEDALENLETLDVIGWWTKKNNTAGSWLSGLMSENGHDRKNISTLYALGCNMATEFTTSSAGNNFVDLRLPDSIRTLTFINSSWENLSFWSTTSLTETSARYDKVGIPNYIDTITFNGTTAKNECSLQLILNWITSIENTLPVDHTEEDLYNLLSNKTLIANQIYWGTGNIKLTYKDVLRLAHFGEASSLKGYILITLEEQINSSQLTLLLTLFGENVFNIGTTNSNLVIDYSLDTVIISISGIQEKLLIINDNTYIKEPNSATLSANHFTLTAGNNNNCIVDTEDNDPTLIENFTENKYIWGFVSSLNSPIDETMSSRLSYAYLEKGNDGVMRLRTEEGNGNDYTLYIRVIYGKQINNLFTITSDTIALNVIAVTYPSDYVWQITGNLLQFLYTTDIAKSLFGNSTALALNDSPIYIFRNSSLAAEFSLKPAEPKYYYNNGVRTENWTANELNEVVEYHIEELGNSQFTSNNSFFKYENRTKFQTNNNEIFDIGTSSYVWATDNSQQGGLPIKTSVLLPLDMIIYRVRGRVKIGGLNLNIKTLYFVIIDDSVPVILGNNSALSTIMWETYSNLYSLSNLSNLNMYKTHLLGIYGALDFSLSNINSLITNLDDSVLKYLPYVTELNFEGCSLLNKTYSLINNFDFSNSTSITSISLKDCTGLNGENFDFSDCINIESLDTRGTSIGVTLPNRSKIQVLKLGSPQLIIINNPLTLGESGTIYSIESKTNLLNLVLVGVNALSVRGFNIFNSLY